jgi:hypothetical protein
MDKGFLYCPLPTANAVSLPTSGEGWGGVFINPKFSKQALACPQLHELSKGDFPDFPITDS